MDILILLGGFAAFCFLGVPVAYALGLAAVGAALRTPGRRPVDGGAARRRFG